MNPQFFLLSTVSLSLSLCTRIFSLETKSTASSISMGTLQSIVDRSKEKEVNNQHDGGGAALPAVLGSDGTAEVPARARSKLNPLAKEWFPWQQRTPEKDRTLFITFSFGYPLNDFQIWQFFTIMNGECVEKVDVMLPEIRRGGPPLFGKVVFNKLCVPAFILRNKQQVKLWVHGRPLWCKKYRSKKYRSASFYHF